MGEIADALKRATGIRVADSRTQRRDEPRRPGAFESPWSPPPDDVGPLDVLPAIGRNVVEVLHPSDPSIAIGDGIHVESARKLAVKVRSELAARGARSVAIVSAVRDEGKTAVACNLALGLASLSQGRDVALVDLDLRRPSVAQVLGLTGCAVGIEQVLLGSAQLAEVQCSVRKPAIDLYPALAVQQRSHELLVLKRFAQIIERLEQRYALVVVDTPPVLLVPDASLIVEHVAACIPVARAGTTRVHSFGDMIETLPRRAILGGVLNEGKASGQYGSLYYPTGDEDSGDAPQPAKKRRFGLGRAS